MNACLSSTPFGSVGPLVGDSRAPAVVLGLGSVEAAQYRDEKAGYDAYVIRQYMEPQLVIDDAIDKICTYFSSFFLMRSLCFKYVRSLRTFAISERIYILAKHFDLMRKVNNIFEHKASRILRGLLANPGKGWSIRALAAEVDVSVGYTHAVVASLLSLGYVVRNEVELLELVNPVGLLERWASYHQYVFENEFMNYYTYDNDVESVLNKLRKVDSGYALTTLAGAFLVSPYVRPRTVELYVNNNNVRDVVDALGLVSIEKDGNVKLVTPYDTGVFYNTQIVDGLKIVSDVQLFVDLKNYPARGVEAAQNLLEDIKKRWSAYLLEVSESVR